MAWYNTPIRPYDPVVEDDKDNLSTRYYRDSFDATGQDSITEPPGQNQAQWELLTNVMPITRGGLDKRWGYTTLQSDMTFATRMASFQRDTDGLRTIVTTGQAAQAFNEDGSIYSSFIFRPQLSPRMVNSRSYAYFFSGNPNDLLKWDGSAAGLGVTNWGINFPSTVTTLSAGPLAPSTATGWLNSSGAITTDGNSATAISGGAHMQTVALVLGGFGFSIPSNATILGIQVNLFGGVTNNFGDATPRAFGVSLQKNNTFVGENNNATVVPGPNGPYAFGSASNLWGTYWLPNDINGTGFQVVVYGLDLNSTTQSNWQVDGVSCTVTYQGSPQAISVATGSSGAITLTVGRIYYCIFQNSGTGHFSDLGPASASTGPVTNSQINLTTIPVSSDTQVDSKVILATADGGDPSELFYVGTIPNIQTTFTDNVDEATLDLNQAYVFTDQFGNDFGVAENTPPPNGNICVKHQGRLWMAVGQNIYFSKSVSELTLPNGFIAGKYEEAWPGDNFLDISEGAETVSGLLSNGQALFIGTQRHIRWITGNDPTNFSLPEVIHAEVGLLNQEVWQTVFIQGTPSGSIWLTPDSRVVFSDFNTYRDIGHPIQDVLDSINPAAAQNAHAMFVDDGEFDLYILAIPTGTHTACDTHCVFNMRSQQWVIWQPASASQSMLFNVNVSGAPQWLFTSQNVNTAGFLFQYTASAGDDDGTPIPITARTSWLHLGEPTKRKLLDELEIVGSPQMVVTIDANTPQEDFTTPTTIISARTLTVSPFGQLKIYLASQAFKDRYYRITFLQPSNEAGEPVPFLRSYNLKSIPFNSL